MTAPLKVKVLDKDASRVEISGARFKQVKLTIAERDITACFGCCARFSERLCEHLAPHCWQGWVFEKEK